MKKAFVFAAILATAATAARADIITVDSAGTIGAQQEFTGTLGDMQGSGGIIGSPISLAQFNPSLGKLNSVTISMVNPVADFDFDGGAVLAYQISFSGPGVTLDASGNTLFAGINGTLSSELFANLFAWIGTGDIEVSASNLDLFVTPCDECVTTGFVSFLTDIQIQYDYTPVADELPVPEPASLGLLALGCIGVAGATRRRWI